MKTPESKKLEFLLALVHFRWALPILAELQCSNGCKFVTLVMRLNLSKDALSRTLTALLELGLVMRNPGYGHPLRPEYILTTSAQQIGVQVIELIQTLEQLEVTEIALKKWSLPVILVLQNHNRFSDMLEHLPGLTTRALAISLRTLEEAKLLEPFTGIPGSRSGYRLSLIGKKLGLKLLTLVMALPEQDLTQT